MTPPGLGVLTTYGAAALQNSSYPDHAEIVERVLNSGAILLGRENLAVSLSIRALGSKIPNQ